MRSERAARPFSREAGEGGARSATDEGRADARKIQAIAAPSPDPASRGHPLPFHGRGSASAIFQMRSDPAEQQIHAAHREVVGEPQHGPALGSQPAVSGRIMLLLKGIVVRRPIHSSTMSRESTHKKSAKYRPTGTCRRNFIPPSRESRNSRQSNASATVMSRRSLRAKDMRLCVARGGMLRVCVASSFLARARLLRRNTPPSRVKREKVSREA